MVYLKIFEIPELWYIGYLPVYRIYGISDNTRYTGWHSICLSILRAVVMVWYMLKHITCRVYVYGISGILRIYLNILIMLLRLTDPVAMII